MHGSDPPDDPLDALLRFQMPSPIAHLYRAVWVSERPDARWAARLALAEGTARFLALVALAEAAHTEVPRTLWKDWKRILAKPGYGGYLALFVQATQHLATTGGPFLPETFALATPGNDWLAHHEVLVELRNDRAHREPSLPDERARALLQLHAPHFDGVVRGVEFLARYPLGVSAGLQRVGALYRSQWFAAVGPEERHPPLPLESPEGLSDGVLLLDPRTQRALSLAPFFHWGRTDVPDGDHLLWLDRIDPAAEATRAVSYLRPGLNVGITRDLATPELEAPVSLDAWENARTKTPARHAVDAESLARAIARSTAPSNGLTLDTRFEPVAFVGAGAMGEVWIVKDQNHRGRLRALKRMLPTAAAQRDAVARFQQEIDTLDKLRGVAGVPGLVFNTGPGATSPYLVMECVEGPSLAEILQQRGALPMHEAVDIVTRALDVLHQVHARGVVHRDLKPSNILRMGEAVWLIDFGIALTAEHTRLTAPLQGVGTIGYLPPEQAVGFATAASDLFAMARTLFVLLAGRLPRRDDERPSEVRPDIPDALDTLYLQATQFDPAARFPSAAAMATAMRAALRPSAPPPAHRAAAAAASRVTIPYRPQPGMAPSPAPSPAPQPPLPSASPPRPVRWAATAALLGLAVVVWWALGLPLRTTRSDPPPEPPVPVPMPTPFPQALPTMPELRDRVQAWSQLFVRGRVRTLYASDTEPLYSGFVRFRGSGSGVSATHIADYWTALLQRNQGSMTVDVASARWQTETLDTNRREHQGCAAMIDNDLTVYLVRLQAAELDPERPRRAGRELPCAEVRGVYLLRWRREAGVLRICHDTWSLAEGVCPSCPQAPACQTRR